jgi:hypothetical protein
LLGLTAADGCIPWAAREARAAGLGQPGDAWAWVAPVHWDVGAQSIVMADPRTLALDEPDARDLMAAMAPYFAEDAMPLHYVAPHRWLCRGDIFRALPQRSTRPGRRARHPALDARCTRLAPPAKRDADAAVHPPGQ